MAEYRIDLTNEQVRKLIDHLAATGGVVDQRIAAQLEEQALPPEPYGDVAVFFTLGHPRAGVAYCPDGGLWDGDNEAGIAWADLIGKANADTVMLYRRVPYPEDGQSSAFDLANMADEYARLDAANELEDARAEGYKDGYRTGLAHGGAAADLSARADTSAAYEQGGTDILDKLKRNLIQLRSSAITAERQVAFDKAIEAVEAMG